MEDFTIPHAVNSNISGMEGEKEKMQDFVCKHLREVTDGSLFNNAEESSIKDQGSSTKNDKQTINKAHFKIQQGAVFSGKILSFSCSVCKDNLTFSPNDLLKHFRAVHKGTLPTYPCDLCEFVTNEFPDLQRHRIEHRNTLVTCELCNDDVQYSLLLLTRHYIMCHSVNGQFSCDWCEFTTLDAGTFVQHIHHHNESHWKCSKCRYISLTEEDHHKHMKAHSGTFPYTCQTCGYGATKREYLKKHTAAVHKEEVEKSNAWKSIEDVGKPANPPGSLKFLLKKSGESQEAQRISKVTCLSGTLQNPNRLNEPEISFEESYTFMDGPTNKDNRSWVKGSQNTGSSTPVMLQECENSLSSDSESHINANGLTVLMVKNRITLPPNCTTKVMGFKMVDGKKHLVLKVIPIGNSSSPNHSLVDSNSCCVPNPVFAKSKVSVENGQCPDGKSSTSVSLSHGSCIQMGNDGMSVKVKIEKEETSVSNLGCTQQEDVGGHTNPSLNSSYCEDILYPITNKFDQKDAESQPNETSIERSKLSNNLVSATSYSETNHGGSQISNTTAMYANKGLCSFTKVVQETLVSKQMKKKVENAGLSQRTDGNDTMSDGSDELIDKHTESEENIAFNSVENSQTFQDSREQNTTQIKHTNGQQNVKDLVLPLQLSPPTTVNCKESTMTTQNCTQNSLRAGREESNQEVFSFHNYFKEACSTSPNCTQNLANDFKHSTDKSSPFSLTLAASSEQLTEVADGDFRVNEFIPSVDQPLTEENPDSLLQDFNIIKIEEDSIPISKQQSEITRCSNSSGSFEEHLEGIPPNPSNDSLKQTKTTLRIIQLPEGKQPLLLKTSPGFKLITNSVNPQINVSYMKPGLERTSNDSGATFTPNSKRIDVPAKSGALKKGTTPLSAVQPGVNTTSSHYLINSPGFNGPVILSSTPNRTFTDKTSKTQPTCYFVQRSQIPFVQNPSTAALSPAFTQLNSQPVLGMPVSSSNKPSTLQSGCQTFLLRYISPSKSGLLLHNPDTKTGSQCIQTTESSRNKVIFKIVTPTGSFLTSGSPTSSNQPLLLTTRPQTQCFLVSSNKTSATSSNRVKKLITVQNTAQTGVKESFVSSSQMNLKVQQCEAEKSILAPRPVRPPSQRKRRRKALFDELSPAVQKARRLSNKVQTEKDTTVLWKPVAKEMERTLRLTPFSNIQQIKCPRKYQPVVVLNHPDADIPEVTNIMKVVNRYKGAVTKVSLSQKTIQALSELSVLWKNSLTKSASCHSDPRPRPVQSSVRERFLLRLKLRRKSKKKYQIVEAISGCRQEPVVFHCWFCGRLFNNQEDWIGHGQRHLMEATRDWNKLF
ncbi:zinc finger protein 518A [Parambassis ranga]|uniref:Zinc finger protein 518A-like n=1 Tax=Parambassis ranga TaxID=210632 RepID=A0A6P7KBM7_9TELE|nr:zinc finger protein 518A-like [Parambassis ranga]XP_028286901.1 zinc finger protein 518A-like [Parambassis ranga]